MTTTTEDVTLEPGMVLNSLTLLGACPVGTVLRSEHNDVSPDTRWRVIEHDGGVAITMNDSRQDTAWPDAYRTDDYFIVEFLPAPDGLDDRHRPGSPIYDQEVLVNLPVGSVVRWTRRDGAYVFYTKVSENVYRQEDNGNEASVHGHFDLSTGRNMVWSVPSPVTGHEDADQDEEFETTAPDETAVPSETYEAYLQRFRSGVVSSARRSSVSLTPVIEALTVLRVPDAQVFEGLTIGTSDTETMGRLPVGSVVQVGEPESGYYDQSIFAKIEGGSGWLRVAGGLSGVSTYGQVTVLRAPGLDTPEWATRAPTLEDGERIARFKQQAWQVGAKAKREQSWCPTYEESMRQVGITGTINDGLVVRTAEEVAQMPVGTILRWRNEARSVLLIRDDDADNPARTRRIGGRIAGSWGRWLEVVHDPTIAETLHVPIHDRTELAEMPVGTRISDGGTWYERMENGRWSYQGLPLTSEADGYQASAFSVNLMYYTRFGPA